MSGTGRASTPNGGKKPAPAKPGAATKPGAKGEPAPEGDTPVGQTLTGTFVFTTIPTPGRYEGEYVNFPEKGIMRHGRGTYTEGGMTYTGTWKEDMMDGEGTITYGNGCSYQGQFKDNKYMGRGVYRWADGSQYEGDWVDGAMHGMGDYKDAAGSQWHGHFYNGSGPELVRPL
ncbi:putative central apparatus associated protein C1a-18 [Paratrimastix pyriformis]|uniref:Central apparatus associated protein C1a-18 n=1 Tax=Paratrimastix pyriformis TaxID=342808 RepID=A0ABQ8UB71_9EUKA|nr:putative central apparatus associated protein C1a-18 [Paratrimastix pyriformis]